jgi:hypothetical protein
MQNLNTKQSTATITDTSLQIKSDTTLRARKSLDSSIEKNMQTHKRHDSTTSTASLSHCSSTSSRTSSSSVTRSSSLLTTITTAATSNQSTTPLTTNESLTFLSNGNSTQKQTISTISSAVANVNIAHASSSSSIGGVQTHNRFVKLTFFLSLSLSLSYHKKSS